MSNATRELVINGHTIKPGQRLTLDLPVTKLYTHTPIAIPIHVISGRKPGPRIFICAAIHGDEINGVEIIRRLLKLSILKRLRGTLITIPVVNAHGFLQRTRYLPDGRDLNRSFPGSERGSLAARLAHLFIEEIVKQCTHGIDLHTGAAHRTNLPQIRGHLDDPETLRLAQVFGVPVLLNSDIRDGSLREATVELGIPLLLYEAGEALRFDELSIRAGVRGIVNVLRALEMLPATKAKTHIKKPFIARTSNWVRAPASGIYVTRLRLGALVQKNSRLCLISDPFGENETIVLSPYEGIIIGRTNLPLVNEGDALMHIGRFGDIENVADKVSQFTSMYQDELLPLNPLEPDLD
ncbi:MAG: succinylglutamate desuccinylase/aspartoacylase family protein [Gammaproteobacteria bacterium]|jgi:predicted deacylase